ncbi:Uncharacterised protein [uncultured Blautia sp.]|nr:Uncharacterised protein [uncultured Blautia sp.]
MSGDAVEVNGQAIGLAGGLQADGVVIGELHTGKPEADLMDQVPHGSGVAYIGGAGVVDPQCGFKNSGAVLPDQPATDPDFLKPLQWDPKVY